MSGLSAYSDIIQLQHAHCDLSGHLTVAQMFLIMQEIAGDDSDRIGLGRQFVQENRIFWVISRVSLTVRRLPLWNERIRVTTWHGRMIRYIFPRYFTLEDESGKVLAEASTLWMLIDRDRREIVFPAMRGYVLPSPLEGMPVVASPGKVTFPFTPDKHSRRSPVYSDFDVNGHMNNSRYPLWICDLFEPSLFERNYVQSMNLNYIREVMQGETVDLQYGMQNGKFAVRATAEGEAKFEATGCFAPYCDG